MKRVVLAKLGLDGHDVGVRLIGKHLADAGFEVVYLGKRVATATIVQVAVQEDADAVGLSCLSGGLGHFASLTVEGLRREGSDVPVLAGGIDEPAEIDRMMAAGVHRHFGPGASMTEIVTAFEKATAGR
ncbi:cobalamin B12-binding domain-containing protein [Amycolatopsis sp. WGS_07]|uniref:cobalamin B12-binding domain-containing protein n=1 Tax=Amycolatopsis sp. WGS_07 TaxID=3076764 RepID=UPI0038737130